MADKYRFVRDAGPEDWPALDRLVKTGEIVTRFRGHTYDLDRDDLIYGGRETIPCIFAGETAFRTVPVEFLESVENGTRPLGNYKRF